MSPRSDAGSSGSEGLLTDVAEGSLRRALTPANALNRFVKATMIFMPSTITKRVLGIVSVPVGQKIEPHYEMRWKPEVRSVATGLTAKWTVPVSAEEIRAVLFLPPNRPGLIPPVPIYRID